MGTWGTTLYGNDASADVRDAVRELVRLPGEADEIVSAVLDLFPCANDEDDEDHADVWLALADQLYGYGFDHRPTFERARRIVATGLDLRSKLDCGLSAKDADRRQRVLSDLLNKLSKPNPKPSRRKILKEPEPHPFPFGTIFCYPADHGQPINPYFPTRMIASEVNPDGWGSAVVLAQGHYRGYFAWQLCARLGVHGNLKPSLAACLASGVENQPDWLNPTGKGSAAAMIGALPVAHVKKMRIEPLGIAPLDAENVAAAFPSFVDVANPPYPSVAAILGWRAIDTPIRRDGNAAIHSPSVVAPLGQLIAS